MTKPAKNRAAVALANLRARALTPERRREIARMGAEARNRKRALDKQAVQAVEPTPV